MTPNFSAYPFERLRRVSRRQARLESVVARWIRPGERLGKLVGAAKVAVVAPSAFDPHAAICEVRASGALFEVRGGSHAVRAIAQRLLGGPEELAAPRPLTIAEQAIWSLVVATALEDLGVGGEVWPRFGKGVTTPRVRAEPPTNEQATRVAKHASSSKTSRASSPPDKPLLDLSYDIVELSIALDGVTLGVQIIVPGSLELSVPPARAPSIDMSFDIPIVLGRCAIPRAALERLAPRSVITLEAPLATAELDLLGGAVGLRVEPSAVVGEVATGYVRRDMSLPDDAHVELTVSLGTTQLSLRQLSELAIGQIISLGRPLAGPFEVRAAGRVVGQGELVDVDGELAVRIVSLGDQE